MNVTEFGLMNAEEAVKNGKEVTHKVALQIARNAHSVIAEEGKRSVLSARFLNLHDGWKYIYSTVKDQLPSTNHALVAVWQMGQAEPYAEILVGHHPNVHINTVSRAAQWIELHSQEKSNHRFFIVDLSN